MKRTSISESCTEEPGLKNLARILVLAFFSVLCLYIVSDRFTSFSGNGKYSLSLSSLAEAPTESAATASRVLKENCGKCHQSTRPTAKPKALKIFDLDQEPWHDGVRDKHLKGMSRQIGRRKVAESDLAVTQEFIACIRNLETGNSGSSC